MVSQFRAVLLFLFLVACGASPESVAKKKADLLVGEENGKAIYQTITEVGPWNGAAEEKAAKLQRGPYLIATLCPNGSEIEDITVSDIYDRVITGTSIIGKERTAIIKFSCH